MSADWFKEAMNAYLPILESNIREELEHMSNTTNNNTSTETTAPKFKVGDRVQSEPSGMYKGTVSALWTSYRVNWDDGGIDTLTAGDITYAKLSEEDAWLEAALMVSKCVAGEYHIGYETIPDWKAREIRHRAYQILGGNGIKVTEDVKARVRALIERAKRV